MNEEDTNPPLEGELLEAGWDWTDLIRSVTRTLSFITILIICGIMVFKLTGEAQALIIGALINSLGTIVVFYFKREEK